ncbi:MAG: GTP-binding protein [Solirubrobacteraceae bacterium]
MAAPDPSQLADRLLGGDLTAAPAALNLLENRAERTAADRRTLLAALSPAATGRELPGHVVGITGPPGAGKSTLLGALITEWRRRGSTVALLAVDPSSKRSGGSLLGDRARLFLDPEDRGTFVRSMASAGQLGGLAPATRAAAHALAACFDVVVVETVGVGQSETEIAEVADSTAVIVQPASGDALQFLKSGIMEVPDVLVVTKSDLGRVAMNARRDLLAALRSIGDRDTEVVLVSSIAPPKGLPDLIDALERHRDRTDLRARRVAARRSSALAAFAREYGERAIRALGGTRRAAHVLDDAPGDLDVESLVTLLAERAGIEPAGDAAAAHVGDSAA